MGDRRGEKISSATPEMMSPGEGLKTFFGWAEKSHPQGVKELVNGVGSLMPKSDKAVTAGEVREGLTDSGLNQGFSLLSYWLGKVTGNGFRKVGWLEGEGLTKGASLAKGINLPVKEKVSGVEVQAVLKSFAATMKKAEAKGMEPTQIIGSLLEESIMSKPTNNGSNVLRAELVRALGSEQNLSWLRNALDIKDRVELPALKPSTPSLPPKPSAETASPAEGEWMRKRGRARRYLEDGNGMDFLKRTYKEDLWKHIGVDGSVKQTHRPLKGVLAEEGLCLRENVREDIRPAYASASEFRRETKFLESVKGPHFIRVYARAPYDQTDSRGFGGYKDDSHWELVDFVDGTVVDRKFDRGHDGSYWPEQLTPAVRLRVLLAACDNEFEALNLIKPVYIADLKTDAFILGKDGETIKQVDCQIHDESVDFSHQTIATELTRLCLELFPANANFSSTDIEKAIGWYLSPERYVNEKRWFMHGENPPTLTEIISLSRNNMPIGLDTAILRFLDEARDGKMKVNQLPMNLANRILPIIQRTERGESAERVERLAAKKREEAQQRALKREGDVGPEQKTNLENVRQAAIMIFESNEEGLDQIVAHYYADRFANNPELGRTQLFADTMHTAVELGIVLGEGFVFERKGPPEKIMSLIQHYNADQKPESARSGLSFFITFMNSLSSLQRRKIAADSFQDEELPKLFVEQFYANVFYSYWAKSKGIK